MAVNCKINGVPVTVETGTTVIEAARQAGFDVPNFCYHPGLSRPANCRMCLVDASNSPKPIPSCYMSVAENVEYTTDSEHVRELRRAILEFILLNHPVDCPICDQAGECELQDNYFAHSLQDSRLATAKIHKPKATPLSEKIIFDGERCIVCTRCVRFCDEIAKTSEIGVKYRGERSEIAVFPGRTLENPYSMNIVDLCPVGALTSRDFRFKCRVWFMDTAEGVCDGCARGCSVWVDHHQGEVLRYRPRENRQVNDWWICDRGRMTYRTLQEERVLAPVTVGPDGPQRVTWERGVRAALAELADAGEKLAIVVSATLDNEALFAIKRLREAVWPGAALFQAARPDGADQDDILMRNDCNPNRAGVAAIFGPLPGTDALQSGIRGRGLTHVLAFGEPLDAAALEGATTVLVTAHVSLAAERAAVVLPLQTHAEHDGTFTNFQGHVQRFHAAIPGVGEALPGWEIAVRLARAAGQELGLPSAGGTLKALGAAVGDFAGMTHMNLGSTGRRLGTTLALPQEPQAPAPVNA